MKYKVQEEKILLPKIKLRKVKGKYPIQEEQIFPTPKLYRKKPEPTKPRKQK